MATGAAAAAHRSSFSEWRYPPCLAIAIEVPEALKIFESDDHIYPHLGSGGLGHEAVELGVRVVIGPAVLDPACYPVALRIAVHRSLGSEHLPVVVAEAHLQAATQISSACW